MTQENRDNNVWDRTVVAWFVAFFGINCFAWPMFDYYKYSLYPLRWLLLAMPIGSFFLWFIGRFLSNPSRILIYVMVQGLFGYLPMLIGLLLPVLTLIFLKLKAFPDALCFGAACLIVSVTPAPSLT